MSTTEKRSFICKAEIRCILSHNGFVLLQRSPDLSEILLPMRVVRNCKLHHPRVGGVLRVRYRIGPKGLYAVHVKPIVVDK